MRRVRVQKLLQLLHLAAEQVGDKWIATCPNPQHLRPEGKVSTPSWSIIDDGGERTGSHHCFGCRFGGGPWELVAAVRGTSAEEAAEWLKQQLGGDGAVDDEVPRVRVLPPTARRQVRQEIELPWGVRIPSVEGCEWFKPAYDYLTLPVPEDPKLRSSGPRGVAPWQLERWHVGYAIQGRCTMRVVFPVYTKGRLLAYVARSFVDDDRPRYDVSRRTDPGARPDVALFGEPGLDTAFSVATVTEGCFGMLAFERAGAPNPLAILGASNLGPEKLELLAAFDLVLVATDPDAAGEFAYREIHDGLCRYTRVRRVPLVHKPDEAHQEELNRAWRLAMMGRQVRTCPTGAPP